MIETTKEYCMTYEEMTNEKLKERVELLNEIIRLHYALSNSASSNQCPIQYTDACEKFAKNHTDRDNYGILMTVVNGLSGVVESALLSLKRKYSSYLGQNENLKIIQ